MSQCVPTIWDVDESSTAPAAPPRLSLRSHSTSTPSADVPMLNYEVAELTWENGQVAMHGLGPPRLPAKPLLTTSKYATWPEKPRASGTLESIVNQATSTLAPPIKPTFDNFTIGGGSRLSSGELVTWFDHHRSVAAAAATTTTKAATTGSTCITTMDALVPCRNQSEDLSSHMMDSMTVPGVISETDLVGCSTRVESCSVTTGAATQDEVTFLSGKHTSLARATETPEWSSRSQSVSGSATFGMDSQHITLESTKREVEEEKDRKKRVSSGKSSVSTKRIRAAAIHNQSERKRRDKINQRMKTLQKLVPNSSKTDKASMLDEVIEYLKNLQAQVQMMSRMNMPAMMLPMAMQQQLQMSMMAAPRNMGMAGIGMGMGMGVDMNMNTMSRPNIPSIPPVLHPSAFMPAMTSWDGSAADRLQATSGPAAVLPDPLSAFLACQSQPMTMDAYGMMAAMYQQFHQPPASSSKS